jgi:hypothetical protein
MYIDDAFAKIEQLPGNETWHDQGASSEPILEN